ncbi:hemerythrin domain-containing protein [Chloroflexota bacterium]
MQDVLGAIDKIIREHSAGLETVRGCEKAADSLAKLERHWIPGIPVSPVDEVRQLQELLTTIHRDLSWHMQFEEEEFLPTITKYAAEIVVRGLCLQHAAILESITKLREIVPDLVTESMDRGELMVAQRRIKDKLDDIRRLLEEHARNAEMITSLARDVIESQTT